MRVLGLETSCDETAAAVVEGGRRILSNVVASQMDLHAQYGGVVPEVASRQHLLWAVPVVERALAEAQTGWGELAGVGATRGPGLAGALLVGFNLGKALAFAHGLPLVAVNHLEAHIYSNWLLPPEAAGEGSPEPSFPLLCLIVSGGHSDLVLMEGHGRYRALGRTRDDAAGEAFDKVARILGLGYPGGPAIEETASQGDRARLRLPRARLRGSLDFSFSGIKTAVLRQEEERRTSGGASGPSSADVAASFQEAMVEMLVERTVEAARHHGVSQVLLAGGVAANRRLVAALRAAAPVPVLAPPPSLCTDNAAMVASCAHFHLMAGARDGLEADIDPGLELVQSP